jgi:Arc/MetJ-type ribon-helix-helix transcriptional regulator
MTIRLPEHLERYVRDQVRAGLFRTEDDVVCDALERHRQAQQPAANANTQASLAPEEIADQELQRRLLAAGIISEIKPPITDMTPYRNRRAVPIQGEPISETAIRERR